MELIDKELKLRPFTDSDSKKLAELCNNKKIWDNLRDYIPFPYSENNAIDFIKYCQTENPQVSFAIEFNGEFAGSIGLVRQTDIYKLTAEIGYWLGEPFWGMGITARAVQLITKYGFNNLRLVRIYTGVFDFNKASQRVLEKAGFKLECIFENSVFKNNKICDEYRYGLINKKTGTQHTV
ncbi:MAG: GNAT family protein [Bacteroidetes bacterium]|nr:GNAT family protein [Bacteroidota bacterium]